MIMSLKGVTNGDNLLNI